MARNPQPWTARVLSQPSLDSDPSFVVTFDDAKYLFNCPENTTRTVIQRKYGFNKYRGIFLSRISSETSAGLPGFIMSLSDSGTKNLKVYGPPGLTHFIASARFYLVRDSLKLDAVELSNEPLDPAYEDGNVKIYAIPATASDVTSRIDVKETQALPSNSLKRRHSNSEEDAPSAKRSSSELERSPGRRRSRLQQQNDVEDWRQMVVGRMFPGSDGVQWRAEHAITIGDLKKRLPTWKGRRTATSYLLVGPEYRGKFDVALADKLQVKKGPDRAKLSRGESVTSLDGKTITPAMVLGPSTPSAALLVVDCPSPAFISGLLNSARLSSFPKTQRQHMHCVFHMVPVEVLEDPRYVKWMTELGPEVHHVVANHTVSPDAISFTATESMQKRLATLDSDLFRVPWSNADHTEYTSPGSVKITPAKHQAIGMRPLTGPQEAPYSSAANDSKVLEEVSTNDQFEGVRAKVESELPLLPPSPGNDVSISCLGTGSAMPGKYRNVSAALVQIPGSGNILLDCGEGTWGQIQRHFGDQSSSVLRNIQCIFLSHIHADHHMGISRLLYQRRKLSPPPEGPIYVVCPRHAFTYLSEYGEIEDIGVHDSNAVRFILAEEIEHRSSPKDGTRRTLDELKGVLGLEKLSTATVEHRTVAFGLVIHHTDGWSLTYSGDTKPCQNLANAGKDSTILIHEATMADDQAVMAEEKAHSTIGQAVDIAKRMRAKKLLLTHFSTRYPKIPVLGDNAPGSAIHTESEFMPEIFVAFDFLHIRLGDFAKAERYLPNLEAAFSELKDDEVASITGK